MAKKQTPRSPMIPPAPPKVNLSPKSMKPASSAASIQINPNADDNAPYAPPLDPAAAMLPAPIIGQELALSLESYYTRFELYQYNPDELITKKGFRVLEKMALSDDTISMGLNALKMMRLSSGYEIKAASDDPLDEQIADEVADNFDAMEGSLREKLFSIMGSLEIGWSLHEKIWSFWEEGPWAGHVRLKTLKSKNPQWFNPSVDDFNNITGLVMISPPAYGRKLPHQKFIMYASQKRYENVFGTSRIRCLYDNWYLKGLGKAALAILLKKYGKQTPMGFYPMTMSEAQKTALLTALTNLGTSAAVLMPEGTKVEWADMDFKTIEGCLAVIEKADQQMTKIMLGQVSSSGTSSKHAGSGGGGGASGSQSGGSSKGGSQEKTLDMYLEYVGEDIANNPLKALIKEIVDQNYEGVTRYPAFVFKAMSEEDQSQAIVAWSAASTAGIVTSTDDDEEHIREVLGFPSTNSKTTLRPNRFKTKAKPRLAPVHPAFDPRTLPIAGYRPPTPSAPGLPANYAESDPRPEPRRALTEFEKGVDFAETWRIIDTDGEDTIARDAAKVIRKALDKLKLDAKKALGSSKAVRSLTMPYRGELAAVLRDGLQDVAKAAMKQAQREIRAKRGRSMNLAEVHNLDGMDPKEVLQLINDRSFTMAGDISDDVLKRVKQVMYNGIKRGDSYSDIVYKIEDAIAPYIDLTQAGNDLSGARLMTAVRTNVSSAYNDARQAVFEDPELDGFTLAYQLSAVLDGDTTDWCADLDGKIYKVSNPIWDKLRPPLWYNCRTIRISITKVDGWDGEESDEPTVWPPDGFN